MADLKTKTCSHCGRRRDTDPGRGDWLIIFDDNSHVQIFRWCDDRAEHREAQHVCSFNCLSIVLSASTLYPARYQRNGRS